MSEVLPLSWRNCIDLSKLLFRLLLVFDNALAIMKGRSAVIHIVTKNLTEDMEMPLLELAVEKIHGSKEVDIFQCMLAAYDGVIVSIWERHYLHLEMPLLELEVEKTENKYVC